MSYEAKGMQQSPCVWMNDTIVVATHTLSPLFHMMLVQPNVRMWLFSSCVGIYDTPVATHTHSLENVQRRLGSVSCYRSLVIVGRMNESSDSHFLLIETLQVVSDGWRPRVQEWEDTILAANKLSLDWHYTTCEAGTGSRCKWMVVVLARMNDKYVGMKDTIAVTHTLSLDCILCVFSS